jgi:hypothetical protein
LPASPTGPRRSSFLALPALAAGLVLLAVPSGAAAASASPPLPGLAKVSRGVCTTSPTDPQARAAGFVVRMRELPGASSYGFAVRLQERAPGAGWKTLKGAAVPAGFGEFETARTGAPRMTRRLNVRGLHPGSSYRVRVQFRWSTPAGVRELTRTSRACAVRDERPNVGLTGEFGWQPSAAGGEVAYRVGLTADGLGALEGVDVPVVVRQGQTVLASGLLRPSAAAEVVALAGRRCMQGQPVTVQLDPDGLVEDRDAADDVLTAACVPVS